MLSCRFHKIDPFGKPQSRVDAFRLTVVVPDSLDAEIVTCGRTNQSRLRRSQQHVVRVIQSELNLPKDVLLGILRADCSAIV